MGEGMIVSRWMDMILVLLMLPSFVLLGSSRLHACIRMLAIQGLLLGLLPLLVQMRHLTVRMGLLAIAVIALKGLILPHFLSEAMRKADVEHEVEPFIGFGSSMLLGVVAMMISFWLSSRLPLAGTPSAALVVTVAFFNMFVGFILLVSRKKALTQVMGYLVLESGIYIFGVALALEMPVLVELGILLDVFVAVFVMAIMILHISRTFDHIDTDQLSLLKE